VCKTLRPLPSFEQHFSQEQEQPGKGYPFTINYVEFKDSGDLWNPTELEDAVTQVKDAVGTDGESSVLLVVYIHGWENNADSMPGRVQIPLDVDDTPRRGADEDRETDEGCRHLSRLAGSYIQCGAVQTLLHVLASEKHRTPRRPIGNVLGNRADRKCSPISPQQIYHRVCRTFIWRTGAGERCREQG
jgi:hypothetical protein